MLGRAVSRDGWRASGQGNVTAAAPAESDRAVNVETVEPLTIALGAWAEATNPDTYFDRWQNLSSRGQALSIASGVFGALGVGLIVPGLWAQR